MVPWYQPRSEDDNTFADGGPSGGMAHTIRYQNGHWVQTVTFPDAVKKEVESGYLTLYGSDGREIRTFSQESFITGSPGDELRR